VVGDHVGGAFEPPSAELIQHLTLVGDTGDHPVECREPIGGDEQPPVVAVGVGNTHLAVSAIAEREFDVEEGGVHCYRSLA